MLKNSPLLFYRVSSFFFFFFSFDRNLNSRDEEGNDRFKDINSLAIFRWFSEKQRRVKRGVHSKRDESERKARASYGTVPFGAIVDRYRVEE